MRDERRRIQRPAVRVVTRKSHDEFFAGARAGDVAEVTLARQAFAQIGPGRAAALTQFVTVGVRQNRWRGRRGGKNRLVHAEHERQFQIGIAGAVNRADEHLIERGRNHADGQVCEAGFQNRQPFAQRQRLVRKR